MTESKSKEICENCKYYWVSIYVACKGRCQKKSIQMMNWYGGTTKCVNTSSVGMMLNSASILIRAKVSLLDVQTILRHTNLTTTQRYVHRLESVRKAIEVFE